MEEAILPKSRQENFVDMISHEIRNPMSAVLHCAQDITQMAHQRMDKVTNPLTSIENFDATPPRLDN
jgi:signal transduction histidine kinase